MLKNKVVLITGGTGSFGQECTKYLLKKFSLKKLIIFSRDELKQYQMQGIFKNDNLRFFIGDVRDVGRLKMAFKDVDYVIHAAALKHVPIAEYNPTECIKTNIDGSCNVVEAALASNVKKVIALSTDKAVNPINLYGATKLCAEKIFISSNALSGKNTKFSVVRYGNVLNSRGSVIPLIKKYQRDKKNNFPLTDEKMTRFFISLEDSVKFVIECLKRMDKGEVFIPKMPSFYIKELIKTIDPKMSIKISGVRPGEKINELLISKDESIQTKETGSSYIIFPNNNFVHSNLSKKFNKNKNVKTFEYSSETNKNFLRFQKLKKFLKKFNDKK